jgi:carboxyl-terminal processing protease
MRVCLTLSATLLFAVIAGAAPVPSPPPSASPAATSETTENTESFAHNLLTAVNLVAGIYVRPVARADLLQSALTGLYEAARRPVPGNLRRRIDQAEKETGTAVSEQESAPPAPIVPALAPRRNAVLDDRSLLELIRGVRAEIGKAESLDGENPLRTCCQAMLRSLDPYSGIITAAEHHKTIGTNSECDGFGLEVPDSTPGRLFIKDVLPGSPAQRAGLRPGDEITRIHDSDGRERKLAESLDVLNGRTPLVKPDRGTLGAPEPIKVTFRRSSPGTGGDKRGGERRVMLDWERFRPESVFGVARRDDNSWNYWLDAERKIAHLRLGNLIDNTPDDLYDIVSALCQDGLRGLILDLRWCPGGSLTGSRKSAEWFLGEGTIATVRSRNRPEDVYRSTNEDKLRDFPMVVLINADTIGGGELIAAALQDHGRAVLVGQRTRGKGNVQTITPLGAIGMKITSGTLIRPSGKNLHRFPDSKPTDDWGVSPDAGREFRISADLSRALRKWWEQQTLRPGSSTERLPLDDPLVDPQRNAAVEALTELMNRKVRAKGE